MTQSSTAHPRENNWRIQYSDEVRGNWSRLIFALKSEVELPSPPCQARAGARPKADSGAIDCPAQTLAYHVCVSAEPVFVSTKPFGCLRWGEVLPGSGRRVILDGRNRGREFYLPCWWVVLRAGVRASSSSAGLFFLAA